jgi:transposase
MAQRSEKWLAPVVFKGACNTELVNTWLKDFLLKELDQPSVIVMDNARFHKKSDIKTILEKAGHTMLPLPTYSPDLNPIEQSFALLKKRRQYGGKNIEELVMSQSYLPYGIRTRVAAVKVWLGGRIEVSGHTARL